MKTRYLFIILVIATILASNERVYSCGPNINPVAVLNIEQPYVIVGRVVTLDASGSYDSDNNIVKYNWDFTNDGTRDYYETSSYYPDGAFDGVTTHIYHSTGTYTVKLRVDDNGEGSASGHCTSEIYISIDNDDDGLPDSWENLYGLDSNDPNDANTDLDSDGYSNSIEYLYNSEPNDTNSIPTDPNTIFVPAEASTIQAAINLANNGETVLVANGTYTGNGNRDIEFNGKAITVRSESDPENCIIDLEREGIYYGFLFQDNEDANSVLDGFTICNSESFYCYQIGCGIRIVNSSPNIKNCIVRDNISRQNQKGGAGICIDSGSPIISNCVITNNNSLGCGLTSLGGGIYCYSGSPIISNCVITNNNAIGNGGGVYCSASNLIISNCSIADNSSSYGPGLSIYTSAAQIINCTFTKNNARYGGGVVHCSNNSDIKMTNCVLADNAAGGLIVDASTAQVTNCTLIKNTNSGNGGAVYCSSGSDAEIVNSILWDNWAFSGEEICMSDSNLTVSYSDIQGGEDGIIRQGNAVTNWGAGNIDVGPLFVDPDANDFHLRIGSPCVNAGDPNEPEDPNDYNPYASGATDIDEQPRINKGVVDIGSDETLLPWCVDADANGTGTGYSWKDAFTTIQAAINAASANYDGTPLIIAEGNYPENIVCDKSITIMSVSPDDWEVVAATVIHADSNTPAATFSGCDSVLAGLTLTGGSYGVSCSDSASPLIKQCVISENTSHGIYCTSGSPTILNNKINDNGGCGVYSSSSTPPTIKNNWIYDNDKGIEFAFASSAATIRNNTIVNNTNEGVRKSSGTAPTISNCILWNNGDDLYGCNSTYSCVEDGDIGTENISSDPLFINGSGDFWLGSYSPCINKGDPNGNYEGEFDIDGTPRIQGTCVDIGADEQSFVDGFEINVTKIIFDHTAGDAADGINIRKDEVNDISVPEWVKDEQNNPAAYKKSANVTIKARFTVSPSSITRAKISATTSDTILGNLGAQTVYFSNGVSNPEYVSFTPARSTPASVNKSTVTWQWKVRNIDGRPSSLTNINSSGPHTIYTVTDTPKAPMAEPWTGVLDIACTAAADMTTDEEAMHCIWDEFYYRVGARYDVVMGGPHYSGFDLTGWLQNEPNVGLVNCYDMAQVLVVFANALGCEAVYTYVNSFGYLNCVKPVGQDWTNNPFYLYCTSDPDPNCGVDPNPIVDGDWDIEDGREGFGNHGFARLNGNIYDASGGQVDVDDDPDYGPPFTAHYLDGNDEWLYYYKDRVIDNEPNFPTSDPVDLTGWVVF